MKSLAETNPYLKDPELREKLIERSVRTSCGVEGIKEKYKPRLLICDIETDGLLHELTQIFCLVAYEPDTDTYHTFHGNTLENGILLLMRSRTIVFHNGIGFDIIVIKRFYPWFKHDDIKDTLLLANMVEPDRFSHKLESYAEELGGVKIQHEDFKIFDENLLNRCKEDVKLTYLLAKKLFKELKSHDGWKTAVKLEHKVANIIQKQVEHGWYFNVPKANELVSGLTKDIGLIDIDLEDLLLPKAIPGVLIDRPFVKNGSIAKRVSIYIDNVASVKGPFCSVTFEKVNLSSEKQMKELLLSLGWQPTQYNYKKDDKGKFILIDGELIPTSPKLTEDSYDSLPEGLGQKLASRLKCEHRLSQIKGLIENVRPDQRLEARARTCAANTARMKHSIIVNIPKAKDKIFLGKEMRSLFTCPEDRILVGCDASALEARCLAHYVNDPRFTRGLLDSDIHTVMQQLSGLPDRDSAKTLTYAILYGAGDAKIGKIVSGTKEDGKQLRDELFRSCPRLKKLTDDTKKFANKHKYVIGIDGRKLFVRSAHSALNVLLQGCGAIIMKVAIVLANNEIQKQNLDAVQIGTHHDEYTFECSKIDAEKVAIIARESIIKAGRMLKLNCPLDGESKIGKTWADIH